MARVAQFIQKTVFLCVNNPRTSMPETRIKVQELLERPDLSEVTSRVLAGAERWLCVLEGPANVVAAAMVALEGRLQPKQWQLLVSDLQARQRIFTHPSFEWRDRCSYLEMVSFLSDMRRAPLRSKVWRADLDESLLLLEPLD